MKIFEKLHFVSFVFFFGGENFPEETRVFFLISRKTDTRITCTGSGNANYK